MIGMRTSHCLEGDVRLEQGFSTAPLATRPEQRTDSCAARRGGQYRRFSDKGTVMSTYSILPDGHLAIAASQSSSQDDFDFLLGGWKIRNRKLKEPLARCDEWEEFDATQHFHQILQGFGNYDIFSAEFDGKPFEGFTLRLFDPQTRLWTIYWADSSAAKLDGGKVGSFDGDIGEFFAREVVAGRNVIVRFHWDKRNPEGPIWSAAFSGDEGHTWEWNWYAYFARP
jgi:hypothetical protein